MTWNEYLAQLDDMDHRADLPQHLVPDTF